MASGAILLHWLQDSYNSVATNEVWENISWSTYENLNASKYDDLSALTPYVTSGRLDSLHPFSDIALNLLTEYADLPVKTSAAKLGLITGLVLSFVLNSKFYIFKFLVRSKFHNWLQAMVLRSLFAAACLILAIIVAPFIGMFLIILMCYRQGVHFYLKMTQPQYVQMFEGLDAIWAVEEETSRSIINVLAFIEVEDVEEGSNLLNTFRKTIVNCLGTPPLPCAKLFYLRRQCLGYFYWEQQTELKIEDYIQPMITIPPDYEPIKCNSTEFPHGISEETLKNIVGELSNTTLPKDHAACWQILVGSQPIEKSSTVSSTNSLQSKELNFPKCLPGKSLQYPIMFRIHHSLGDGIALMQLLVSIMNDIPSPTASLDTTYIHSPRLPPIPMPSRKFQYSNNSENHTLLMKGFCKTGENSIGLHNRHQAQSPTGLNVTPLKMMSEKRSLSEGHSKANVISIDLQSIEENSTVIFHNDNRDEPKVILRSAPSCSHIKTNSSTVKYRQRPLLLKNCSESCGQLAKPTFHEQSHCKSERSIQANCNQNPCPTPQPIPKFKTVPDSYSKISGSCNQPLTTLTTGKLSPSINSNFQTSLPILNLCQTSKSKSIVQQLSQNTSVPHSRNYESENDLTNSLQNTRCQPSTQTRMSLEEPPSLFNKSKSTSSRPIPKSTYRLPTLSKIPCSKNTTLHCYNCTMSDSYITIPEDLVCSTVETSDKGTNTSTTIYYYTPATSPEDPTPINHPGTDQITELLTNADTASQESIQSNRSVSPLSNEQISLVSGESGSSESSFEDRDVSATQTMFRSPSPTASSPSISMKSTPIRIDKYTVQNNNYLGWDSTENEGTIQNRKIKSDGDLDKMPKLYIPGLQIQSTASMNKNHGKYQTRKISTFSDNIESPNIQNTLNVTNQYDEATYNKKETEITVDSQEEYSHWFRRLRSDWNKLQDHFKGSECKDTNKIESMPALQSGEPNQYVQLLNTISNSTCSLKKPERFSQFLQTICALALSPASLIHQALMKAADRNVLHGPPLTGYKVTAWHRDLNGELFNRIKKVKSRLNTRFTEVFLTALSASLETYFETHQVSYNDGIPGIVNVVIPARMEQQKCITTAKKINITPVISRKDKRQQENSLLYAIPEDMFKMSTNKTKIKDSSKETWNISRETQEKEIKNKDKSCNMATFDLNNRFSVAMLQLPVSQAALSNYQGNEYIKFSPRRRLEAVCHNSELLRQSLDYHVNYWLLKVVASYLTKSMLNAVVRSSQSTLVVSNIMGPTQELNLAGSKLKDIIFWVPQRGTTGIGVTVLSYMGRLQIGIMADRAVIHCKEDAQMILDEIVVEMSRLDAASSQPARSTQGIVIG